MVELINKTFNVNIDAKNGTSGNEKNVENNIESQQTLGAVYIYIYIYIEHFYQSAKSQIQQKFTSQVQDEYFVISDDDITSLQCVMLYFAVKNELVFYNNLIESG